MLITKTKNIYSTVLSDSTDLDKLFKKFGWSEISTNNHSTFGNKWRIINMIKRIKLLKLIRYIRKKNMVSDNSILDGMFDLDYELLSKIIED